MVGEEGLVVAGARVRAGEAAAAQYGSGQWAGRGSCGQVREMGKIEKNLVGGRVSNGAPPSGAPLEFFLIAMAHPHAVRH